MRTIFELCTPREDVLRGSVQESDFAADLAQVLRGTAPPEYQDAATFFANTHPTGGLKRLIDNVCRRLGALPADQTAHCRGAAKRERDFREAIDRIGERIRVSAFVRAAFCGALMACAIACSEGDRARPLFSAGSREAQDELATPNSNGVGAHEEAEATVRSYREAADQGAADAQFNLGVAYSRGKGVPKDAAKAVSWFRKAADQGDVYAQFNLSAMYFRGEGCPKDFVQACKCTNLAAAQGDADAAKLRDELGLLMTPEQVEEARRFSREWTEQHTSVASRRNNQ